MSKRHTQQSVMALTDTDVSEYLSSKQDAESIGERDSCLLYRTLQWKYPDATRIEVVYHEIRANGAYVQCTTEKQHQQMMLFDDLLRGSSVGMVTKGDFLTSWKGSWMAHVETWNQ